MAASQITDAISWADAKIEVNVTQTPAWLNISGETNSIEQDGGDRMIEVKHTAAGDTPILTAGKREELTFTVHSLYNEAANDASETVRAAYAAKTPIQLRWSPKGGTTGQKQYTTAFGFVESYLFPVGDAGSADAVLTDWSIKVSSVTVATLA